MFNISVSLALTAHYCSLLQNLRVWFSASGHFEVSIVQRLFYAVKFTNSRYGVGLNMKSFLYMTNQPNAENM